MKKQNEEDLALAKREAAHTLLVKFINDNAQDIAHVMEDVVPYLCEECGIGSLAKDLNIVNTTFAYIALQVIKAGGENELTLPADATQMQDAVFEFTRFIGQLGSLESFLERFRKDPAITLCCEAFSQKEVYA